jgi:hypothetical protein
MGHRITDFFSRLPARWQDDLRALGLWAVAAAVAISAASAYALTRRPEPAQAAPPVAKHVLKKQKKKRQGKRVVHRRVRRVRPEARLEAGAALGLSHVLFERSPGGVLATAARTARYRGLVNRAARGSGFSPDLLEAMVFLESAGYSDAIAGADPVAASGLTQIVAQTGAGFLRMRVDLHRSRRLTRLINRAEARGKLRKAARLVAARRRVDQRFDPAAALAGTVRYLEAARRYLGRDDLAVASYHMGIGNLQGVIARWARVSLRVPTTAVVRNDRLSYAELFFTSAPDRHPGAWARLNVLADDTRNYLWKVLAAERIMWLYRHNPRLLEEQAWLQGQKRSAEEVLHPRSKTARFRRPKDLVRAWNRRELVALPGSPATTHLAVARSVGQVARRLKRGRGLYRGLRPGAMEVLLYIGRRVHQLSGARRPLLVTSEVRDERYQRLLRRVNANAAHAYSLHTTGYAFDLARSYGSRRQAAALQFVLDRLEALNLIAYIKEPAAIHVAVASGAAHRLRALRAMA